HQREIALAEKRARREKREQEREARQAAARIGQARGDAQREARRWAAFLARDAKIAQAIAGQPSPEDQKRLQRQRVADPGRELGALYDASRVASAEGNAILSTPIEQASQIRSEIDTLRNQLAAASLPYLPRWSAPPIDQPAPRAERKGKSPY